VHVLTGCFHLAVILNGILDEQVKLHARSARFLDALGFNEYPEIDNIPGLYFTGLFQACLWSMFKPTFLACVGTPGNAFYR
jgi:hypothetical protein